MNRKKVLAICGSTRRQSTNHSLIQAMITLSNETLDITVYSGLEQLPQFNPDRDGEDVAIEVADLRRQLDEAEGVIICTPEYAHGVPGSLKNAIDWTVSTSQFPNKPTLLITASTGGEDAHRALMETLRAINAGNIENLQLIIPFAKTKISLDNEITDENTLTLVKKLLNDLFDTIEITSQEMNIGIHE